MSSNAGAQSQAVEYDEGLRSYMLQVYNYMASALIITGLVAYFASGSEAFLSMMLTQRADGSIGQSPLSWVVMLAPLGVVFFLGAKMGSMSIGAAKAWFWGFSVLMGLSLYYVFALYTGTSITRVFFITAGTFGAMSLYGYTTNRDLTKFGSFLMMGVFGIIIASLVNIFLQSSALYFAVSVIGVLLFVGLIAYDTQKIKAMYYQYAGHAEAAQKSAIMGALSLYLDFINLFIMLLRLFGERR
ncbi:MAG: Bax inhibitor-1/YccA family protein [Rickettsiales bacterium]|nr:Bax inhibitor-1/YccA family protein [Rickettsiales bacterium]